MMGELLQRHAKAITELSTDRQGRVGFATLDLADVFPAHSTFTSQTILREACGLAKLLQTPRQPLADTLGVVVGVVVVRRYGYGNSCGVQNGQRRKH